ncbi:DNA-binding transcriptional LysR family regulator [Tamaricihabitans halophyticus]|uniref:DNA-binding transcriptional LysR family regulator n=1 Tax=Tamaricihabitans halophyticus TaxID=1262583 RepID=A0A4R2QQ18_9PSEU|nr:LysR family transcriptional regulator [Tamaricihabitans halophyticus]TCP50758.1 DNA-binding transcriptional LysR family regulator [Tamaricihabitans halophyticus]
MIDRRLTVLRAVARHGTVTAAAEVCHLTPSAVSHQLQALAQELDVPLVERVGRNVRLTPAAHALLAHADTLIAQWEQARADLAAYRDNALTGPLRLCGFSSAAAVLLPATVTQLRDTSPQLTVQVREAEPRRAFDLLTSNDVDIGAVVATQDIPTATDPAFEQHFLLHEPLDLLVAREHPLARTPSTALADASTQPWIVGTPGSAYHQLVWLTCASAGFVPHVAHYADEWDTGAALVARGFGVALIPRLAHVPEAHQLARLPLSGHPAPTRRLLAAVRAGSGEQPHIAAGLAALRDVAARYVASTRPQDPGSAVD